MFHWIDPLAHDWSKRCRIVIRLWAEPMAEWNLVIAVNRARCHYEDR